MKEVGYTSPVCYSHVIEIVWISPVHYAWGIFSCDGGVGGGGGVGDVFTIRHYGI